MCPTIASLCTPVPTICCQGSICHYSDLKTGAFGCWRKRNRHPPSVYHPPEVLMSIPLVELLCPDKSHPKSLNYHAVGKLNLEGSSSVQIPPSATAPLRFTVGPVMAWWHVPTLGIHRDYPLVNIQTAIENGHRNYWFTHKTMGFSILILAFQRVPPKISKWIWNLRF